MWLRLAVYSSWRPTQLWENVNSVFVLLKIFPFICLFSSLLHAHRLGCRRERCVFGRFHSFCHRLFAHRWWSVRQWPAHLMSLYRALWPAVVQHRWWPHRPHHKQSINNRIRRVSMRTPNCVRSQSTMKVAAKSVWPIRRLLIRWCVAMSRTSRNPFRAYKIQRRMNLRIGHRFTYTTLRLKSSTFRINYGNVWIRSPLPTARWNGSPKNFRNSRHRNASTSPTTTFCR